MDLREAVRSSDTAIETLPLVPLRENVVFPHQLAPLGAGRPRSVAALEQAVAKHEGQVVLAVQRDATVDEVTLSDLHPIAVVAGVGALRRMPNGAAQALVEGQRRVRIVALHSEDGAWVATVTSVDEDTPDDTTEAEALTGSVRHLYGEYASAGAAIAPEVAIAISRATDSARVADIASAAPDLSVSDRVELLQETGVVDRLRRLVPMLGRLVEVAQMRSRIQEDVQNSINKGQRELILREQLKALRKELSELEAGEGEAADEEDLAARVEKSGMPEPIRTRALKEVQRLEQIPSASPELGMVRTYVDWLLDLPWGDPPREDVDIDAAARILDEDHYGLDKVKDRILEWLAVRQRTLRRLEERDQAAAAAVAEKEAAAVAEKEAAAVAENGAAAVAETEGAAVAEQEPSDPPATDEPSTAEPKVEDTRPRRHLQTPILCFVGPPGVGKTSLGRSVARALGRKFVRLSLGGIRDEAEIRGHRRTYIGALPGRIIQSMKQAGTRNPVIMLDEIDKVGMDFRGDPSAALLEVLDPEQNREFSDHYLEVQYDLSHVLFITTANQVETISAPLRDRMELIRISGYTEDEKVGIAEAHLMPKQLEQHGLDASELIVEHEALVALVRGWTREAGVRQLDRTIAEIARKVPRRLAKDTSLTSITVTTNDLEELLGPQRFEWGEAEEEDRVGVVTGCVVSDVGGDIVTIEALAIEGRSDLVITGQLGNVMEESARAAISWSRVNAERYGAAKNFFDTHGLHIHVPAGATPKDGPSAGITMTTAVISVASGRKVRRDVAMTGEVTLRGRVLPIGGVKDKLLAAHRAGILTFVLPSKNERDLHDVDADVLGSMRIVPVDSVDQVLDVALLPEGASRYNSNRRVGFVVSPDGRDGHDSHDSHDSTDSHDEPAAAEEPGNGVPAEPAAHPAAASAKQPRLTGFRP
jgi:ATP-dependent Lon protease